MPVNWHCHGLGMSFRLYGSCSHSCWISGLRRFVFFLFIDIPGPGGLTRPVAMTSPSVTGFLDFRSLDPITQTRSP